jgi:hypothetical protein
LRGDLRDLCRQLFVPPPQKEDAFCHHPDGTPMVRPKIEAEATEARSAAEPEKKRWGRRPSPRHS